MADLVTLCLAHCGVSPTVWSDENAMLKVVCSNSRTLINYAKSLTFDFYAKVTRTRTNRAFSSAYVCVCVVVVFSLAPIKSFIFKNIFELKFNGLCVHVVHGDMVLL